MTLVHFAAPALWDEYRDTLPRALAEAGVTVLTPSTTLAALRAGYLPSVHPSAGA